MYIEGFPTIHNLFNEAPPDGSLDHAYFHRISELDSLEISRTHLGEELFRFVGTDSRVIDSEFGIGLFPYLGFDDTPTLKVDTKIHTFALMNYLRGTASFELVYGLRGVLSDANSYNMKANMNLQEMRDLHSFAIDLLGHIHPSAHILAQAREKLGRRHDRLFSSIFSEADKLRIQLADDIAIISGIRPLHRPFEVTAVELKTAV